MKLDILVHPFYGYEKDPLRTGPALCQPPYYENMPKYSWRGLDADTYATALLGLWTERLEQGHRTILFPCSAALRNRYECMLMLRAIETLGDKLIVAETPYRAALSVMKKFSKYRLDVSAFGEMSNVCVNNYSSDLCNIIYRESGGKSTISRKVLPELCGDSAPQKSLERFIIPRS